MDASIYDLNGLFDLKENIDVKRTLNLGHQREGFNIRIILVSTAIYTKYLKANVVL